MLPHRKSFAAIPSISPVLFGHTNRSVSLSHASQREVALVFRHFQDRFLTTNREKWGKKAGLCFARFVFLAFCEPFGSHDSNPYSNRGRMARCNATKVASHALSRNVAMPSKRETFLSSCRILDVFDVYAFALHSKLSTKAMFIYLYSSLL